MLPSAQTFDVFGQIQGVFVVAADSLIALEEHQGIVERALDVQIRFGVWSIHVGELPIDERTRAPCTQFGNAICPRIEYYADGR